MSECFINIAPDEDTRLGFVLRAEILKTSIAGMRLVSRPRPTSLGDDLLRLRFGDAPDDLVQQVTAKISEWVLGNDLNGLITAAINLSAGQKPLRLIFSIDDRLRELLADIPFELIVLNGGVDPLVLNPRMASIVHLLDKVGTLVTKRSNWPLKILIVRSNPRDLGGAIPPAEPIRQSFQKVLADDPAVNPKLVVIDILSSEDAEGIAGRPTKEGLEVQLPRGQYDILIYVGHGDIAQAASPGAQIGGVLQLEDETGDHHRMLDSRSLADLLGEPNPVPVVLLLGCLTAAENLTPDMQAGLRNSLPQWLRGSQGVAQALINSRSGVQLVVGMRYKIDTQDALDFLDVFFRSLLKLKPGDVETAVRAARSKLSRKSYMWSAPVVFSALGEEPLFPFLEDPPKCPSSGETDRLRNILWDSLSKLPWSFRQQPTSQDLEQGWRIELTQCDQYIINQMKAAKATVLIAGYGEFKSGEQITLPVKLNGTLTNVDEIEGKITVGTGQFPITNLEASQHLTDSNYELTSLNNNTGFLIRRTGSGAGGVLGDGDLFNIIMTVASTTRLVLPVSVSKIKTKPVRNVCPVDGAIVLPLP